jgi:hypothetical protein
VPSWLIAAALVLIAGATATAVMMQRGSDDASAAAVEPAGRGGDQLAAIDSSVTADDDQADDGQGQGGGGTDSGGDTNPGGRGSGGAEDRDVSPVNPRLTAATAGDVLFELFDRIGMDLDDAGITRDRAALFAARDTALQLWGVPGIVRRDSALAATIIGTAAIAERDAESCRSWLERAATLGDPGARTLLSQCDGNSE